jgi:hypothetical protein
VPASKQTSTVAVVGVACFLVSWFASDEHDDRLSSTALWALAAEHVEWRSYAERGITLARHWIHDPTFSRVICEGTSQRVSLLPKPHSSAKDESGVAQQSLLYEDSEITVPVVVTQSVRRLVARARPMLTLDWTSPHALRPKFIESIGEFPSFGSWLRVEEAVISAVFSLPALAHQPEEELELNILGGWSNGVWTPGLKRILQARYYSDDAVEDTALAPLDLGPEAPWVYVPGVSRMPGHLEHVTELDNGLLYAPPSHSLRSFEGHLPFVRRTDGTAVLALNRVEGNFHRGEDYDPRAYFIYADQEVTFEIGAKRDLQNAWEFEDLRFHLLNPGVRELDRADRSLWTNVVKRSGGYQKTHGQPSYSLLRRLTTAFIDAGLAWSGESGRLPDDPAWLAAQAKRPAANVPKYENSGVSLERSEGVSLLTMYAGAPNQSVNITAHLPEHASKRAEVDGWIEAIARRALAGTRGKVQGA